MEYYLINEPNTYFRYAHLIKRLYEKNNSIKDIFTDEKKDYLEFLIMRIEYDVFYLIATLIHTDIDPIQLFQKLDEINYNPKTHIKRRAEEKYIMCTMKTLPLIEYYDIDMIDIIRSSDEECLKYLYEKGKIIITLDNVKDVNIKNFEYIFKILNLNVVTDNNGIKYIYEYDGYTIYALIKYFHNYEDFIYIKNKYLIYPNNKDFSLLIRGSIYLYRFIIENNLNKEYFYNLDNDIQYKIISYFIKSYNYDFEIFKTKKTKEDEITDNDLRILRYVNIKYFKQLDKNMQKNLYEYLLDKYNPTTNYKTDFNDYKFILKTNYFFIDAIKNNNYIKTIENDLYCMTITYTNNIVMDYIINELGGHREYVLQYMKNFFKTIIINPYNKKNQEYIDNKLQYVDDLIDSIKNNRIVEINDKYINEIRVVDMKEVILRFYEGYRSYINSDILLKINLFKDFGPFSIDEKSITRFHNEDNWFNVVLLVQGGFYKI